MLLEAIAGSDRLWTVLDATVMRVPRKLDAVRSQIVRTRVGQTPADSVLARLCPNNRVRSGLCAGLQFPAALSAYNARGPMLLGCYERVLQERLICLCADRRHDRVIDIGCAEGFYAVGLAMRLHVPVIAFDSDPRARAVCREMATLNEAVIDVRDACTPEALREALWA